MGIYDFKMKDANGNIIDFQEYKGKVLLIVNTATGCGFTPQYEGLETLYKKYHEKGFEVLDFPCNQFANQAPGTDEEIVSFCKMKYDVTFKQFSKIEVNGENESPLYTYLKNEKKGFLTNNIKWNFTKFLVDKNGKVIERYAPTTTPEAIEDRTVELLIEKN